MTELVSALKREYTVTDDPCSFAYLIRGELFLLNSDFLTEASPKIHIKIDSNFCFCIDEGSEFDLISNTPVNKVLR